MTENDSIKTKVFSGLTWVYLENSMIQLVGFILSVILARMLEPTDYGTIALVLVFVNIANVFVTNGFSYALIQKKNADELDYSSMFWFSLVISFVLYLLIFLIAPVVASFYGNRQITLILRILALRIPFSAYNSIQQAYVSSHMIFKKSFISNSVGVVFSGIFGVVLAYLGAGIWALVTQSISSVILSTIFLTLVVKWKPILKYSWDRLGPLISFGWKILLTGLMFTGYNELRSLIIGKRYSTEELGYYNQGYSFPRLLTSNVVTTINRVLFPALSQIQNDLESLKNLTRRAVKISTYIMTPLLFGLAVIAQPLVLVLLGEKWLPSVSYLQILCLVWWLQPSQTCSIQSIKAIGRSDVYLRIELISKIVGILVLVCTVVIFNTVIAITFSMLFSQMLSVIIYGIYVAKETGYRLAHQAIDLLIPTLLSIIMVIMVYFVSFLNINSILLMILQILVGAGTYLLLSIGIKSRELKYLIKIVADKLEELKIQ